MCLSDEFRLCSCDADHLDPVEIGWMLTVQNMDLPGEQKMGKCKAPPSLTTQGAMTVDAIESQLNTRNCFDFSLEDGRMYHAKIRAPGSAGDFFDFVRTEGGVWKFTRINSFTKWKPQMEPVASGRLHRK